MGMTQSAFSGFFGFRNLPTEHHVYPSIFNLILVRTYNNITIYTPEYRRASMGTVVRNTVVRLISTWTGVGTGSLLPSPPVSLGDTVASLLVELEGHLK